MKKVVLSLAFAACSLLGFAQEYNKYLPSEYISQKKYDQGLKYLQEWAPRGIADAQYYLGIFYYNGYGVAKNYAEAISWFKKAADQGETSAMIHLGHCYYDGLGVAKNQNTALQWYKKAGGLIKGFSVDSFDSSFLDNETRNGQYDVGLAYIRVWLSKGKADAQHFMGVYDYYGYGVEQNNAEALSWFRKAASQGHVVATRFVGHCYYNGRGVAVNYTTALQWYSKAAAKNDASAYNGIAYCYVKQNNLPKAIEAIDKAIAIAPNNPNYYDSKGEILMLQGKKQEALQMYKKIQSLSATFFLRPTDFSKMLKKEGLIN
ncbi:MAG: tetratricopeptide repeat protein [Bacteroidales bacterium]|nr:tetratricopeptide repeat protein [Bacteroidales bacterium]